MGEEPIRLTHYAILIGIDAYSIKPLESCVRDVKDIEKYLERMPVRVHIQMFTATKNQDSFGLVEDPESWPTYDNVTSSLRHVTSLAKAGDFVYIHFSGHGTALEPYKDHSSLSTGDMTPMPSRYSNPSTGDLALVVLEITTKVDIRYLRGKELADLIRAMVEKDIIITLVLDCCFSGSVMRDNSSARFLRYDPKVDAAYPSVSWLNTEGGASRTVYRNASMRSNWLLNPDGYTILTACGPTEIAEEIDSNGQKHGALSYFLLRTFAKLGHFRGQQRYIYSLLCARFREALYQGKIKQNPMFYGNKNLSFFGPVGSENNLTPIPIINRQDHGLQLEAGFAHGICDDDQFSVFSSHPTDHDFESGEGAVIARVTHVRALTSNLETLNNTSIPFGSGLIGIALTHFSLRKFPVRLKLSLPYPEEWTRVLQDRPSLDIYDNSHTKPESFFSFYVAKTDDSYEIRDESNQRISNLPTPTSDLGKRSNYILDVIEHLAMFKMVRNLANHSLANKADPFNQLFSVKLVDSAGKEFDPGCFERCNHPECLIEVESGEALELVVRNQGNIKENALYLHVLNMGSHWEIENCLSGNHEVVPPRNSNQHEGFIQGTTGERRIELEMQVPPGVEAKEQSYYEDIIKVFITFQSTSFVPLELPEIGKHLKRNGISRARGDGAGLLSDDWAASNFLIRSKVK